MEEPRIIFQDNIVYAVCKPSGLTVNRSDTTIHESTLQDWIEKQGFFKGDDIGDRDSDFYKRSGIVHRLDKETSGILLAAKTLEAFTELQRQFKERIINKTYTALAHGDIAPSEGEINVPVGRLSYNRKRFGIVAGGRESLTYYKTLKRYKMDLMEKNEALTLLELYPKTGRTHQIRVHLKYIGHPIFGDELYSGRKTARADRKYLQRFFLHASAISFLHPSNHDKINVTCELTQELRKLLDLLEQINSSKLV